VIKELNIQRFWRIISVVTLRSTAIRTAVGLFALFAWFSVSNHCALGAVALALVETKSQAACPFHSKAPEKKSNDVTCCKVLRATLATTPKSFARDTTFQVSNIHLLATESALLEIARLVLATPYHNTGPPGKNWFTESVLQRSILAHAPPSIV